MAQLFSIGSSTDTSDLILTGQHSFSSGQIYAYSMMSPDIDNMSLESIHIYTAANTGKIACAVYAGGSVTNNVGNITGATLIGVLPTITGNNTEEWKEVLSATNPVIPKNSLIWIVFICDEQDGSQLLKGRNVTSAPYFDILSNARMFTFSGDNNIDVDTYSFPATVTATTNNSDVSTIPNLFLTYGIPVPNIKMSVGNQLIEHRTGGNVTGMFDYLLFEGSVVDTAVLVDKGVVNIVNGDLTIQLPGGTQSLSDPMLLMIQDPNDGEILGIFSVIISELG